MDINLPLFVNSIFLLFLFILTLLFIGRHLARPLTPEQIERHQLIGRMGLVILPVTFGIGIVIVLILWFTDMKLFQDGDVSNWFTLIVEIGIGVSIALIILIYSLHADQKTINTDNIKKSNKENHAREEIYKILRSIPDVREWREKIRTKPEAEFHDRGVTKENEVSFSNKRVIRTIKNLSFTLSIYSEYLPEQFVKRVNDAINGYDFILNRLELMPMENDDPANILNEKDGNKGFIEELKKII